ncbi:hypothetical protein [Nocardia sp. NBC_00511]|uniref:hypothetical protein n=1 Tax=Nocardia sp. NBC_00511 TaxID=2903591 RepID=UPI0030DF5909
MRLRNLFVFIPELREFDGVPQFRSGTVVSAYHIPIEAPTVKVLGIAMESAQSRSSGLAAGLVRQYFSKRLQQFVLRKGFIMGLILGLFGLLTGSALIAGGTAAAAAFAGNV